VQVISPSSANTFPYGEENMAEARAEAQRFAKEASLARSEVGRLRIDVLAASTRVEELRASNARLATDLREAQTRETEARTRGTAGKNERDLLEVRLRGLTALQAELAALQGQLETGRQEVHSLRHQLADSEARLKAAATNPETEQTLRQDLAVKTQAVAAHEHRVKHLEEENAHLQQELKGVGALGAERDRMLDEIAELRAGQFAARPRKNIPAVALRPGGNTAGGVLQSLVEQVSSLGDVRCSVIADELGLVVASHGELAEEVAAAGALFGRAALQAQSVLPLRNVQRVTVEDDQNVILGLRPLRTDAGTGSEDLVLITLAVGAGPDPRQVAQIIDGDPRSVPPS
jgi:predicted  nucleic acid-binding Zn-ribbon protein